MTPDTTTVSDLAVWATALMSLLSLGTSMWNVLTSKARSNAQRIDQLATRVEKVERDMSAMPARDDMHALHIALTEIRGDLKEMRATMAGHSEIMTRLETVVSRHEDHLLDGAKR